MADTIDITAGTGTTVATDDVGGNHYQRIKISDGTADSATHLKVVAEDAAHTTGDTGLVLMAVRQDAAASLAGTDGDYLPLIVDANGRLHILDENSADSLTAVQSSAAQAVSILAELLAQGISLDTITGAIAGTEMQVDVLTSALPSDAATQTTLAALLTELQAKADLAETQPVSAATLPLPSGAATDALQTSSEALLTAIDALLTTIDADTSTVAGAVAGSEMQADIVSSALPTDAATQTTLAALLTELQAKADLAEDQPVIPHAAMTEVAITELVGINEQVDQNDYGASVSVALGGTYSGELLSFILHSTEDGSGAVLQATGQLMIFDADPTISAGDTSITNAERLTLVGIVDVAADDWLQADANGASAYVFTDPIPFHALSTIYLAWFHTHATSFNDGAGDDEQLEVSAWFRRDS